MVLRQRNDLVRWFPCPDVQSVAGHWVEAEAEAEAEAVVDDVVVVVVVVVILQVPRILLARHDDYFGGAGLAKERALRLRPGDRNR